MFSHKKNGWKTITYSGDAMRGMCGGVSTKRKSGMSIFDEVWKWHQLEKK